MAFDYIMSVQAHFTANIALHAATIGVLAFLTSWLLTTTPFYATALAMSGVAAILVASLFRVIRKTDRSWERFLAGLRTGNTEAPLCSHGLPEQAFQQVATVLRAMRTEWQQQVEYLRTLLDTVSAALIVVRRDGQVSLANRAAQRLGGVATGRLNETSSIGPHAAAELLSLAPGARRIIRLANGQLMLAAAAQFMAPGRDPERLISLQRVAGELDAVQLKAWQNMSRVLAHEIMNSLTPISSLSESLEMLLRDGHQVESASAVAAALEAIKRRSLALMSFVERYRKVVELPPLELEFISVAELLTSIERLMSARLSERSIRYFTHVVPRNLSILADPGLLGQALINLLHNAIDAVASSETAQIELRCECRDDQVVLTVIDNGIGLPEQDREQIFVPFFTTKPGGSGIGLTIASQVALVHGGTLNACAAHPRGSTFSMSLPVLQWNSEPRSNCATVPQI
jgi:nitrogen fixation/metabolism regulation signal transduction histidine kinase